MIKILYNHPENQNVKRQSRLQQTTFISIFNCFSEKIRLNVSSESSARQMIHMKNQALKNQLFSSKDNSKKLKCLLVQFVFLALFGLRSYA